MTQDYYGTKLVSLTPMTRAEYNQFRGWELPSDENGDDPGYRVEYKDGGKPNVEGFAWYISWTPKEAADKAYTPVLDEVQVQNALLTTEYTEIFHEAEFRFNAPHHFIVKESQFQAPGTRRILSKVDFQEGPIKEVGVNGIHNEDLLAMVITRLQGFQNSEYACEENAQALNSLFEALSYLRARTDKRKERGVEGTHTV